MFYALSWSCLIWTRKRLYCCKRTPMWLKKPIMISIYLSFLQPWDNTPLMMVTRSIISSSVREINRRLVSKNQPKRIFISSSTAYTRILVKEIIYFIWMGLLWFNGLYIMWISRYTDSSDILEFSLKPMQTVSVSSI